MLPASLYDRITKLQERCSYSYVQPRKDGFLSQASSNPWTVSFHSCHWSFAQSDPTVRGEMLCH